MFWRAGQAQVMWDWIHDWGEFLRGLGGRKRDFCTDIERDVLQMNCR